MGKRLGPGPGQGRRAAGARGRGCDSFLGEAVTRSSTLLLNFWIVCLNHTTAVTTGAPCLRVAPF